jgi:hypothetical protein
MRHKRAGALLVGGVILATGLLVLPNSSSSVPTYLLNPNVTQGTIKTTICVNGWTKTVRPPVSYTNKLKRDQLSAQEYTDKDPTHYEEDHWIPLAVGGAPKDPHNLWPELWDHAHKKDVIESRLHREVCSGRKTLKTARAEMYKTGRKP